jgi:hypothetical protein
MSIASRTGMLGALLAGVAAAGGTAAPQPQDFQPAQRAAQSPVREYVTERKQRLPGRKKKSQRGMRDPQRSYPWQRFKNGDAIDGRGDFRSAKRLARQAMCAKYGVTTGRQWVRLRRALRRAKVLPPPLPKRAR